MKAKLIGLVIALAMLGLGGHMIAEPVKYESMKAESSGRRAIYKKGFATVVNTIGATPTGVILVMGGAGFAFFTLRPKPKGEPAHA